ncbi:hypothetical protein [Rhodovulum visakhapatnamense]|uniref:Integrase-like protein n=1 Tax=Rhodovulum visakhapatnamense TaxID=364297 RepID=A0A4R8FW97_9RHOB|nr:hypothetical protein EV657_11640 [Rhodovulum visakhapatnamense]
MKDQKTTSLRERMIEDMRIRGMGDKAQKAHIRATKDFAALLRRKAPSGTSVTPPTRRPPRCTA